MKQWGETKSLRQQVAKSTVLNDAYAKYKAQYKNTKYGQEIIRDCATFGYFR